VVDRTTYASAGVDVEAGDRAVELMAAALRSTWGERGVVGSFGGFGAAVALPPGVREPVLVSSADGVGTKTAIAVALGRYDTIGIDLVAMVVDDIVCTGARPLFLQDYIAVGRLEPERVAALVEGIAAGCREAGVALVGGETAEHPGLMGPDDFDLAGFGVGVVERDEVIDGNTAEPGDAIVGIPASGLHANGFSLVRALLADDRMALFDELLTPTRIYAPPILTLRDRLRSAGLDIRGLAHVTGGGLPANLPRALPAGLAARIDPSRWETPPLQRRIADLAGMGDSELRATLNGGIGMALVVAPSALGIVEQTLPDARVIGEAIQAEIAGPTRYVEARLGR
jgi:phosphoribosylformylglycinamidine cyclo-ligase